MENNVLPEDTRTLETQLLPDETNNPSSVAKDATTPETEPVLPHATNKSKSPGTPSKDGNLDTTTPTDDKPGRGVFKTKTITILRSKDPRTFKCSVCGIRAPTLDYWRVVRDTLLKRDTNFFSLLGFFCFLKSVKWKCYLQLLGTSHLLR